MTTALSVQAPSPQVSLEAEDEWLEDRDERLLNKIPIENVWLLMLYASKLLDADAKQQFNADCPPDKIADMVADLLASTVELRLRRSLSQSYREETAVLNRVRGRINMLETERRMLLDQGKISCTFDLLTIDTPRNRFVRAALLRVSSLATDLNVRHRCRAAALQLARLGVQDQVPAPSEVSGARYGHHDANDRYMVELALLAWKMDIPSQQIGSRRLADVRRIFRDYPDLYERAIGGMYRVMQADTGWVASTSRKLTWQVSAAAPIEARLLPAMKADIVLDDSATKRRIVIDTKFMNVVTTGQWGNEQARSSHVYQIYAYLRSQEGLDDAAVDGAAGMLLYPSINVDIDEMVMIQGHAIRFATVNLSAPGHTIKQHLRDLLSFPI